MQQWKNSKAVFLLSSPEPDFIEGQKNVIKVAKQLGIKHIVKLLSGDADSNSQFYIPRIHGAVDDYLIKSGINYTILRPMGIMQNWPGDIAKSVKKERKFYEATGKGKRVHVGLRDIA
ncbi:NAD(P)H-binding protein [Chryseobacterium sp. JK1]|uniref:NAD(P)H-binding protein n=1 Tax=Chryseobacterium sp. JK1 TaxID=874294 RepID=UPI003D69F980